MGLFDFLSRKEEKKAEQHYNPENMQHLVTSLEKCLAEVFSEYNDKTFQCKDGFISKSKIVAVFPPGTYPTWMPDSGLSNVKEKDLKRDGVNVLVNGAKMNSHIFQSITDMLKGECIAYSIKASKDRPIVLSTNRGNIFIAPVIE
jgi:hypothetical protein